MTHRYSELSWCVCVWGGSGYGAFSLLFCFVPCSAGNPDPLLLHQTLNCQGPDTSAESISLLLLLQQCKTNSFSFWFVLSRWKLDALIQMKRGDVTVSVGCRHKSQSVSLKRRRKRRRRGSTRAQGLEEQILATWAQDHRRGEEPGSITDGSKML